MGQIGDTAVVFPVPAADALVAAVRQLYPQATHQSVVAHVSAIYPFAKEENLDSEVMGWLAEFATQQQPQQLILSEVAHEPGFVSLSVPSMTDLVNPLRTHWPQWIPYHGRFGTNPIPHITLAMGTTDDDVQDIKAIAAEFLPLTIKISQLWLVVFRGVWETKKVFQFGA